MLGINSYMAHLGKCIDLARREGHKVIGLVYDQALSGGFITSGLMADACYALAGRHHPRHGPAGHGAHHQGAGRTPESNWRKSNPVFAPGPENYLRMGGIQAIWKDDLAQRAGRCAGEMSTPATGAANWAWRAADASLRSRWRKRSGGSMLARHDLVWLCDDGLAACAPDGA